MITIDDFEVFCQRSFGGVLRIADDLGDELINRRPTTVSASSPFALVTHILGACEWWVGHILLGEPSQRVRADEFTAVGTIADLRASVRDWLATLHVRKPDIDAATSIAGTPSTQEPLPGEWTVGAVLLHVYEELAQHLGHLEITADLLLELEPMDRRRRAAPQSRAS